MWWLKVIDISCMKKDVNILLTWQFSNKIKNFKGIICIITYRKIWKITIIDFLPELLSFL